MVAKDAEKFVVYDNDDEVIEYVSMQEIISAYRAGVRIFDFTERMYDLACNGTEFIHDWHLDGMAVVTDKVRFGNALQFRKEKLRENKKREYLAFYDKIAENLLALNIYHKGILYRVYIQEENFRFLALTSNYQGFHDGGRIYYFGFSTEYGVPVIGASDGVYKLCFENMKEYTKIIMITCIRETYAGVYRKLLFK